MTTKKLTAAKHASTRSLTPISFIGEKVLLAAAICKGIRLLQPLRN
ncbi:hypothetical protein IVB30_19245 [Bradyrhizobium sp. 200]|nr:hypothetical protein [Bradyrhizobium sp. 200]UPJ53259.1 hypothetical protein IVB30_19245 [Bradyrhizobium sp. 200]